MINLPTFNVTLYLEPLILLLTGYSRAAPGFPCLARKPFSVHPVCSFCRNATWAQFYSECVFGSRIYNKAVRGDKLLPS